MRAADFVSRDNVRVLIDTDTFKKQERERINKEYKTQVFVVLTVRTLCKRELC